MDRLIRPFWKPDEDRNRSAKILCGVVAAVYISNQVVRKIINIVQKQQLKKKIKEKREESKLSKAKLEEHLKGKEISTKTVERILSLSFKELQAELQSGKLSAVDVLNVYQIKALEVDKRTNCITEIVWEAEETALQLDLDSKKKGPLYGIPVSIKETYTMPGYPCTGGMMFYFDDPVTEENILVQVLKKQGAIPFVRTNVPQTLMTFECSNSLYGTTGNPYDPTRIPGGSSGGEAALIGGGGSILGMGGDIGGSLRIPAHMAGCCSLKPSGGRLSRRGQNKFNKGETLVQAQTGPMAAEVDGLVNCMRCLLVPEMFTLDPAVPPIPFREEIFTGKHKLTIGFYIDDGNLKAVPACQRAVLEVKAILESQGHTLVPFKPVDVHRMVALFLKSVFADGGKSYVNVLEKDIVDPSLRRIRFAFGLPHWFRKLFSYVAKIITKDQFTYLLIQSGCGVESVTEYWDLAMNIESYRTDFLKKWRDNKLDAVICPGFAFTAVPSGRVTDVTGGVTYTNLYNLLDYTAGTLKVTNVTQADLDNFKHYPSNTWMEKNIKKFAEGSKGLPVGVQFVGLSYQEELVLRLMKEVETCLHKNSSKEKL
ncbi:vitamin D3 hydroxylase-associated protein-like isoform X2 [Mytilus californianus]|nr:vitamin D3 hydroxylase-associated protein-like isoform X2 [Mytilus californianus]